MGKDSTDHVQYGIEDRPPVMEAVPLGFQHVFAMLLGNIAPALIIGDAVGLGDGGITFLVQMALLVAGVATLVQVYAVGAVGARLPIMMGTSFAFVGPLAAIGGAFSNPAEGLAVIFGACLVGAVVEVSVGFSYKYINRLFPPLVSGIVVMLIGLTLIPVGMEYAAGGAALKEIAPAQYGSFQNLGLAGLVFFLTLFLNQFFRGFLRIASVFFGLLVGYIAAIGLGVVDFTRFWEAAWIAIPMPLEYGVQFDLSAILVVAFLYAVTAVETIGDMTGTVAAVDRQPTTEEIRGGLFADGIMSAFASVFSAFPNTSFSQNVGVVNFTGVASRHVVGIAGLILIVFGLSPKIAALAVVMPDAVLGGGALILFAMIFSSGVGIIKREVDLTHRNTTILAVSVGLGLAVETQAAALAHVPADLKPFVGSGLLMGGISALVLNLILPKGKSAPTEATVDHGTAQSGPSEPRPGNDRVADETASDD